MEGIEAVGALWNKSPVYNMFKRLDLNALQCNRQSAIKKEWGKAPQSGMQML